MLFPEEMTELELIVPEQDLLAVTKALAGRGIFHQVDASNMGSQVGVEPTESWRERAATYSLLERQLALTMQTLSVEEGSPQPEQPGLVEVQSVRPIVEQIEQQVKDVSGQLTINEKKITQLQNQIRELAPIANTGLDMGVLREPRYIHSTLGTMPVANIERMKTSLSRTPHVLEILNQDRDNALVWLTGTQQNADILDRAARSAFLNPLDISGEIHQGTPSEIIVTLNQSLKSVSEQIEQQKSKLAQLSEQHKTKLQDLLWRVRASRLLADAMAHYGKLNYTYLIVGWVPSSQRESLEAQLRQASKSIIVDARPSKRTGHGNQHIPVAMRNPGFLGAFELLVNTYARPRYEEIDPTVLIAVTFPLLYGAMYGDVGHGLVLAAFGLLLASKVVPVLRGGASLGGLLIACGLSGAIFGFIFGSVFGFEEVLPHHPFFGQFVLIQPIHSIIQILAISIGVGIVLLNIGLLLNLYSAYRARDWGRLLFDSNGLFGWILYLSFLILIGQLLGNLFAGRSIFPSYLIGLAYVGLILGILLAVIFSEPLKHWMEGHYPLIEGGLEIFAVQSAAELLEKFISMFSNTMSYVRVGAFAIVHAGFTGAVFVIAKLLSGGQEAGFTYWAVVVFGNLFVIMLEGFIVAIQTMRLHYYEFFSKFFTGGGSAFEPLTLATAQEK